MEMKLLLRRRFSWHPVPVGQVSETSFSGALDVRGGLFYETLLGNWTEQTKETPTPASL